MKHKTHVRSHIRRIEGQRVLVEEHDRNLGSSHVKREFLDEPTKMFGGWKHWGSIFIHGHRFGVDTLPNSRGTLEMSVGYLERPGWSIDLFKTEVPADITRTEIISKVEDYISKNPIPETNDDIESEVSILVRKLSKESFDKGKNGLVDQMIVVSRMKEKGVTPTETRSALQSLTQKELFTQSKENYATFYYPIV